MIREIWGVVRERLFLPLSFKSRTPAWKFFYLKHNYSTCCRGFCAVSAKESDLVEAGVLKWSDRHTYWTVIRHVSEDFKFWSGERMTLKVLWLTVDRGLTPVHFHFSKNKDVWFPWQLKHKTFQSHASSADKSNEKLENTNVKVRCDQPEGGFTLTESWWCPAGRGPDLDASSLVEWVEGNFSQNITLCLQPVRKSKYLSTLS